jgi:hypothetical protein
VQYRRERDDLFFKGNRDPVAASGVRSRHLVTCARRLPLPRAMAPFPGALLAYRTAAG